MAFSRTQYWWNRIVISVTLQFLGHHCSGLDSEPLPPIIHVFYHLSMLKFSLWTFIYSKCFAWRSLFDMFLLEFWSEDKQKKRKHQKVKVETERSTLQRSKTFVSLLFKSGRRRERSSSRDRKDKGAGDGHRGRSKSPKHLDNEPGECTCGLTYFDEDHFLWNSWGGYLHLKSQKAA